MQVKRRLAYPHFSQKVRSPTFGFAGAAPAQAQAVCTPQLFTASKGQGSFCPRLAFLLGEGACDRSL
ncbi:MAG: hypothetical protein GPJ15_22390 [Microcystis aeruginosa G11-06]|nr:hypothetical protein [Microcystis aeruginosa G11-06]